MDIASIALFFIYVWGFGFSSVKLMKVKEAENFLERNIMRIGLGLGALIIAAMLLNIVNAPLDWRLFLVISSAYPLYHTVKNLSKFSGITKLRLKPRASDINAIIVIIVFIATLYMYVSGAFSYPYLEDDDSWGHAAGTKYIATEKTLDQSEYRLFQYMNPYPPAYDFIMGLMHQTTESLYWTIKFFNALIISLSLMFFYFFMKEFAKNRNKALVATIILAAIPAYESHFIWAPALAMTLLFPAVYAIEMIKHDRRWKFIAAISFGALLISHPTHALMLFPMVSVYVLLKIITEKDLRNYAMAHVGGIAASLSWWGVTGKNFFRSNILTSTQQGVPVSESVGIVQKIIGNIPKVFSKWSGTASRPYTFSDFFVAKGQNLINNPVGIGIAVSILFITGLVGTPIMGIRRLSEEKRLWIVAAAIIAFVLAVFFANSSVLALIAIYAALMAIIMMATNGWRQNTYFFVTLLWFIISFIVVNNLTFDFPLGFFAFRTWMIMAVPIAIIAAEGLWNLFSLVEITGLDRKSALVAKVLIILAVLAGVWMTSGQQKYEVNTAQWPPGAFWSSYDELASYVWLKNLPADTKVFSFVTDDQVIGMDKYSCGWCKAESEYRKGGFNDSAENLSKWMNANGYTYIIIGGLEVRTFGQNETINKLNKMAESGLFNVAYQTNGAVVLRTA